MMGSTLLPQGQEKLELGGHLCLHCSAIVLVFATSAIGPLLGRSPVELNHLSNLSELDFFGGGRGTIFMMISFWLTSKDSGRI